MNRSLRQTGCSSGATLLELLVSVAILGMIASITYGTFTRTLAGRDFAVERVRAYTVARTAIDWIERDLRSASSGQSFPGAGRRFMSVGSADAPTIDPQRPLLDLTTATAIGTAPLAGRALRPDDAPSMTDQARVVYRLERDQDADELLLARYEWRPALVDQPDTSNRAVIARGIVSVELHFFDGTEWESEWSALGSGGGGRGIPAAVETRVTIESDDGEEHSLVSAVWVEAAASDES
jgi:prepilin-type N-terminal cleavage/methylation domain-containing protein